MDFLKILRSFEDFIFEAATWLVFYPLTLWRIICRPLTTLAYSDREQGQSEALRYDDALSPPLVLLATLVIANLVSLAAHIPPPEGASMLTKALTASARNLVLFRSLVFSLVPLVAALTLLKRQGIKVTRQTLRAPFYAQCYLAAPCAAFTSLGSIIFQRPDAPDALGLGIAFAGAAWFLAVQTRWFRQRLSLSWGAAAWTAAWGVIRALAYLVVIVIPLALL